MRQPNNRRNEPASTHRLWHTLTSLVLVLLLAGCVSNPKPQPPNDIGRTYVPREVATQQLADNQHPDVIQAPEGLPSVAPTVVGYDYDDYNDPLIRVNRAIFAFNDFSYRYVLIPLANGYVKVVPLPVRDSLTNFFYNLKSPIYFVNNLLQLEGRLACRNLLRFAINSTIGLLGFFDPAEAWFGLERAEAHFDDTLMRYGADYGIYIVIPFLGPSDLRDSASAFADFFLNPINYLVDEPERFAVRGLDFLQDYASDAERYKALYDQSDDPYILFRNLYLQSIMRDADYEAVHE